MVYKNLLSPLKESIPIYRLGAFDVETIGISNEFYMGSCISEVSKHGENKVLENKPKVFYDREEMINFMIDKAFSRRHIWFATNLSFDILSLFKDTDKLPNLDLMFRDSRMLGGFYRRKDFKTDKHSRIKFYDTMNHQSGSVASMGKIVGLPKYETPCFLGSKPSDEAEKRILEDYNIRDTMITFKWSKFLQENYNKIGCELKITLPSSSMNLFRKQYLKEDLFRPPIDVIKYLLKGYYGGRCEAIKRGRIKDCYLYDINSLYPTAMALWDFPHPNKYYHKEYQHNDMFQINKYEGVAEVEMYCPNMNIPYLPVRHNGKLIFPCGYIKGSYTFFEIREAIKIGYEMIKIHSSITYTKKHRPFKDFVHEMFEGRYKEKLDKSPTEKVYKILMNSLYGKFAQRIEAQPEARHLNSFKSGELTNLINDFTIKKTIIGDWVFITKNNIGKIPNYINPIYSIYTTAISRHILYKKMPRDVYYMDTDSCITQTPLETGDMLGEWKLEANIEEGVIVRPKFYRVNDRVKVKGCSRINFDDFNKVLEKEAYHYTKFTKFKESIRRGFSFNEKIEVTKELDLEDNKREWESSFNSDELEVSKPLVLEQDDYKPKNI